MSRERLVDAFDRVEKWAECNREDYGTAFIQDGLRSEDVPMLAKICAPCAVKRTCFDIVNPQKSLFSGMCAGIGWNDGVPTGLGCNATLRDVDGVVRVLLATLRDEVI